MQLTENSRRVLRPVNVLPDTLRSSGAEGICRPGGVKNESGKGRKSESEKNDDYILLSLPSFPLFALLGLMKHNT